MSNNEIHQAATRIAAGAREADVLVASSAMPASISLYVDYLIINP